MHRVFIIFAIILLCVSCAQKEADQPQDMKITVDFREVHLCSRISPEITVAYAPAGTKFYKIHLTELANPERLLGTGIWKDDGSGIIPEGALNPHYTGPCPPRDQRIEYVYVVSAQESPDSQPLAVRQYRFMP